MKKYLKWEYIKRLIDLIQFLIVVFGVSFSVYQINDIHNNQLSRKNELSLNYYDRLTLGTNGKITRALAHNSSIFKNFNSDDIDDYLNIFNDIGDRLNKDLLDTSIACNDFYDVTETAYKNKEIQGYITTSRKSNSTYFLGFDDLHKFLTESCND